MIKKDLIAFLVAFLFTFLISPLIVNMCKKLKARQTILHYVKEHELKNGTPTMGGIIFILSCLLVSFCFLKDEYLLAVLTLMVMFLYGLLGFLDDFLKVHFKQNLGLKPYQKIVGQVGIALIIAIFVYVSNIIGTEIYLPFTSITIDLSWGIIPFIVFVYLAVVNSVNLIDGLDGLATGVSFVVILSFASVIMIYQSLNAGKLFYEQQNIQVLCYVLCGCLLAYFIFNCFPAKIFMGDTGSLALGGFITTIAVFSKLELYIPIIGIMYVITALSDILQVVYYKKTKKRIFLMAPLHHHFQIKGVHENKIVAIYIILTMIISLLTITLILNVGGY